MTTETIARIIHEACKALCDDANDYSQMHWADAEEWQRASCISGVEFILKNPGISPEESHNAWVRDKINDGWKYGPEKNATSKEHPCIVPFDELPDIEKAKDHIFTTLVPALMPFLNQKEKTG